MRFGRIYYWFRVLEWRFFRKHFLAVKVWFLFIIKDIRLRRKGYSGEEVRSILDRHYRMNGYKIKKEIKESQIKLIKEIAELSEQAGIHQWDLRDKINKDFDLDI